MKVHRYNMINTEKFVKVTAENREILQDMKEHRVFDIFIGKLSKDMLIGEVYSEWFGTNLTKERCEALSKLFSDLAECFDTEGEGGQ